MEKIQLNNDVSLSRIIHGQWRLQDWNLSAPALLDFLKQVVELGITSFDQADIYGNYSCEAAFGEALALDKSFRKKIQIITKCGINLISDKYPNRTIKHYDYSYQHIINSVEQSLRNFHTDTIDVLLLHRPSPFFNAEEVARAFNDLEKAGKVLSFGVSNFNQTQFEALDTHTDQRLVTNQIEISPFCLQHFENNNLDFLQMKNVSPMAWSPLAGGDIMKPETAKGRDLLSQITIIGEALGIADVATVVYAWLLAHPARILPICGTGKLHRLKNAVAALHVQMTLEQWFKIYTASTGKDVA